VVVRDNDGVAFWHLAAVRRASEDVETGDFLRVALASVARLLACRTSAANSSREMNVDG